MKSSVSQPVQVQPFTRLRHPRISEQREVILCAFNLSRETYKPPVFVLLGTASAGLHSCTCESKVHTKKFRKRVTARTEEDSSQIGLAFEHVGRMLLRYGTDRLSEFRMSTRCKELAKTKGEGPKDGICKCWNHHRCPVRTLREQEQIRVPLEYYWAIP